MTSDMSTPKNTASWGPCHIYPQATRINAAPAHMYLTRKNVLKHATSRSETPKESNCVETDLSTQASLQPPPNHADTLYTPGPLPQAHFKKLLACQKEGSPTRLNLLALPTAQNGHGVTNCVAPRPDPAVKLFAKDLGERGQGRQAWRPRWPARTVAGSWWPSS